MAAPAFAHVTTDPSSAPKGGELTLGFRVPNEEDSADTTQFEIDIPTDHPLLGIDVESTFQEFHILVQTLPKDIGQVVFRALQTYSDGTTVRWIVPVTAGQDEPDHPTPILTLTEPASGRTDVSHLAKRSAVDSAQTIGIVGLVVGALGLVAATFAIATRPRRVR